MIIFYIVTTWLFMGIFCVRIINMVCDKPGMDDWGQPPRSFAIFMLVVAPLALLFAIITMSIYLSRKVDGSTKFLNTIDFIMGRK